MIIRRPRHPNHLSQDPDSISQTFLEQFVLVKSGRKVHKLGPTCQIHLVLLLLIYD